MQSDGERRGVWAARLVVASFGALVTGLAGASLGLLPGFVAFRFFLLALPLGLIGVFAGAWAWRRGGARYGRFAVIGGLVALLPILVPAASSAGYPPINDISTDLADPPAFTHALTLPENAGRDMELPADFHPIIRDAYADLLTPKTVPQRPTEVLDRLAESIRSRANWSLTRVDPAMSELEAVVTSGLFRFQDDVVVRLRATSGGTRVDIRSKSRVGKGDLGANANRIRGLLALLDG